MDRNDVKMLGGGRGSGFLVSPRCWGGGEGGVEFFLLNVVVGD